MLRQVRHAFDDRESFSIRLGRVAKKATSGPKADVCRSPQNVFPGRRRYPHAYGARQAFSSAKNCFISGGGSGAGSPFFTASSASGA